MKRKILIFILTFFATTILTSSSNRTINLTKYKVKGIEILGTTGYCMYKDACSSYEPLKAGQLYKLNTYIVVGKDPKDLNDTGKRGEILFKEYFYISSPVVEQFGKKKYYSVSGTIEDLLSERYVAE